jgi:hypothetical protein
MFNFNKIHGLVILISGCLISTTIKAMSEAVISPSDAEAPVTSLTYQSPFITYQEFENIKINPWRNVNAQSAESGNVPSAQDHHLHKHSDMKP